MIEGLYKPFQKWSEKNAIWLVSDTHFDEDDLRTAFPNRPDPEELVKIINQKVGKNGTLIHLGDVGNCDWAKKLKGYKILICGNHDSGGTTYANIFDEIYTGPLIISDKIILSHEPLDIDWLFNIHGHVHHSSFNRRGHLNCCIDANNYIPINFNQFIKSGRLKEFESIHRSTIDIATIRARKREKKYDYNIKRT